MAFDQPQPPQPPSAPQQKQTPQNEYFTQMLQQRIGGLLMANCELEGLLQMMTADRDRLASALAHLEKQRAEER